MSGNLPLMSSDAHSLLEAQEVASFRNYHDAQAAIDKLSEAGFPLTNLAIIGKDVRTVERILGRMGAGKVFLQGLLSGLWLGLLAALMVSLITDKPLHFALLIALAVAMGLLTGTVRAIGFMLSSRRRGFASARTVIAQSYSVVATTGVNNARTILGTTRPATELQGEGPTPFGSRANERPKFGVRVSETEKAPTEDVQFSAEHTDEDVKGGTEGNTEEDPSNLPPRRSGRHYKRD